MVTRKDSERSIGGVGTAAVLAKTGKGWNAWLRILDKAGAKELPHKEIAAYLRDEHGVSAWWSQMVTVGYEQERGLRNKHEKTDGYSISRSKTIDVPLEKLFGAWKTPRSRARWLEHPELTIRTSTPNKSMRITWEDETHVDVHFTEKGPDKSQVAVQHKKLASKRDAERRKQYWGDNLASLKERLEG